MSSFLQCWFCEHFGDVHGVVWFGLQGELYFPKLPLLPPFPRAEAGERRRVSCPFSKAVLVLGQGIRQYEEETGEEE